MATIPKDDPATYDMICRADTVGVFQVESRAQMSMLPRLKPRKYYDLVIEVSIVRPGPITGGMVHPYLRRRAGEEEVVYPHACLEPVLKKTLGVPLFQEQVIRLAMVAADYTPGEADQLRRDMAAWRRSGAIEQHRERLVQRMTAKGIETEFAERVFEQIRGFGEYGFPESHAASFALIAYATAWMRCHYPEVFCCSLLNAQPMGFYSAATIVDDARRHGVELRPIDVTRSLWDCTLEERPPKMPEMRKTPGNKTSSAPFFPVRMGLRYVKGMSEAQGERIVNARAERRFVSIDDFVRRTRLDAGTVARLAETGAFEPISTNRRDALWSARGAGRTAPHPLALKEVETIPDFVAIGAFETIRWDYRTAAHSTHGHPLEPIREQLAAARLPTASEVIATPPGRPVRYAGIVICRQRPGTAAGVVFMTLEDETGFVNVVIWEKVFEKHHILIKTTSFIGVTGRLQSEHGVVHIIADTFWVPDFETRPEMAKSRDFH
jgi:error-prone DNA polymerase